MKFSWTEHSFYDINLKSFAEKKWNKNSPDDQNSMVSWVRFDVFVQQMR